jgi:hypothetical protein
MNANLLEYKSLQGVLQHLIEAKKKSAVFDKVPFTDLEFIQSSDPESDRPVDEYGEAWERGDLLPPLDGVITDDGVGYVFNGNTRAEGIQSKGGTSYSVCFTRGTRLDAIAKAAGANDTNGRRRTNSDKRAAVRLLLSQPEFAAYSPNYLGSIAKVSPQLVDIIRTEMVAEAIAEGRVPVIPEQRIVRRGDQTYTTKPKSDRKPRKTRAELMQSFVDQTVVRAKKFDTAERSQLGVMVCVALRTPPSPPSEG